MDQDRWRLFIRILYLFSIDSYLPEIVYFPHQVVYISKVALVRDCGVILPIHILNVSDEPGWLFGP